MKKHCLFFFHNWNEWKTGSENVIHIYDSEYDKRPLRRVRTIVQVRECSTCKLKGFKTTKIVI